MASEINQPVAKPAQTLDYPSAQSRRREMSYLGIVSIACGAALLGLIAFALLADHFSFFQTHPRFESIFEFFLVVLLPIGFISGGIGCFSIRDLRPCLIGLLLNTIAGVMLLGLFLSALGNV